MNRHLAIKMSCFSVTAPALPYYSPSMDISVVELRNSPAITRIPRLESGRFNCNLFDPDLIRGSLVQVVSVVLVISSLLVNTEVIAEELTSYAFVNDDATLRIKRKTIHLYGIHIPKTGQNCRTSQRPPVCGSRAALALEFKVKRFVRCEIISENPNGSLTGLCRVNYSHFEEGDDLSAYLLERGWAVALPDAPIDYHTLEKIARSRGIGVWGIAVDRH